MIERFAMKNRSAFFLAFLLTFWISATQAGPIDGWGLFLDVGQLKPVNDASGREYQDSKVIGDQIDYQFALGDSFSFSLFTNHSAKFVIDPKKSSLVFDRLRIDNIHHSV